MQSARNKAKKGFFRCLAAMLSVALVITMAPINTNISYADTKAAMTTETPEILVSGTAVIGGDAYTAGNVGMEKAYTRAELKAMDGAENVLFSAKKSKDPYTKLLARVSGVYVSSIFDGTKVDLAKDKVSFIATDKYEAVFDPEGVYENGKTKTTGLGETRYVFPGLLNGSESGKAEIQPMLGWAISTSDKNDDEDPQTSGSEKEYLTLAVGQLSLEDMNNSLYNKNLQKVIAGDAITEKVLSIDGKEYTRGEVLLMDRAERTYTYSSSGGNRTEAATGVPMSVILKGYDDSDVVTFETADNYGSDASGMTVKELIDGNYMLAYEKDGAGIYETAKNDTSIYGFLTLYGDGAKPSKLVNNITVESASGIDFAKSPYKHITNGGRDGEAPFNIDAITGATLTVEGPGVKTSVPLPVRDLENRNAGAFRGDYSDVRNGETVERTYEGIDLYYVLNEMKEGTNGIILMDNAKVVEIKNRNRDTVATFTMKQVADAHEAEKPILISYGTSYTDGSGVKPFVFDGGAGADKDLGNEDGCLKLVYDKSVISGDLNTDYEKFASMAYIYVADETAPGFKHNVEPYDTAENTEYVLTITGDEIGREVNYKVSELEDMVEYDENGVPVTTGFGHRDEYKLANNTYWYVNEYEGVKLWDLLQTAGLDKSKSSDDETLVTFTARDGYTGFDKFTLKQVADPECFGYYEKNPQDNNDGKYKGEPDDLLDTGYPVLVAYGVNKYPYVIEKETDGFLSGLSNDGGPLRIISGKLYYNHANGSSQAQKLDKVIVGDDTYHYSTHKFHDKEVYTKLADETLTVKVVNGATEDAAVMKEATYTVGEIEELIYGKNVSSATVKAARIKGHYEAPKNGSLYSDLYEGVDLIYFLKNVVKLPGEKGTITFTDADGESYSTSLDELLKFTDGYNTNTKISGLSPVLAYAKNGAPMVNSKNAADGYEDEVTLGKDDHKKTFTIKNNGGPLSVMIPNTSETAKDAEAIASITDITINLSPDNYAHIEEPYDTYASETLTVSGEGTRLAEPKEITVAELEGEQILAETAVYSILKDGAAEPSQTRFRGINVYKLLKQLGLKSNADKVIFTCGDGSTMEFSLSEVSNTYKNTVTGEDKLSMILAYGSAPADSEDPEDGKPLVDSKDSEGYDKAYGNNGGPLKLVVGQTDAVDTNSKRILKDVVEIEVTASENVSWDHNSAEVYKQYLDDSIQLIVYDENDTVKPIYQKTLTVADIEAMTSLVEREVIFTSSDEEWEGVNLWGMLQAELKDLLDTYSIVGISPKQGSYGPELIGKFGEAALKNGIEGKPIIVAYAVNGKPLVPGSTKTGTQNGEGFDPMAQNNGGPLRTITQKSTGTCIQELERIEVVVSAAGSTPQTDKFETAVADKELPYAGVRSVSFDKDGGMWVGTYGGGAAYKAPGADKFAVYDKNNGLETGYVSAVAADADGGVWMSQNASYTEPDKNKGVVYMDKDGKMTSYTVEGNPGTLPDNYVQDIKIDSEGNVWFASFGGLTKYNPASNEWKTWTKADSNFPAEAVTKIEFDGNGGVWLGFYPEGTTDGNGGIPFTGGYAHMTADGKVTSYPLTAGFTENGTSKLAEVWIRDLAVDRNGGVWIVASGAYANVENVGGSIWYVSEPGAEALSYTGDELFGDALDGANNAEVRVVTTDNKGGLWFGTSADGIFYVADPTVDEDGKMAITTMYNTETGSWDVSGMNNVYSLDIYGSTLYAGTNDGLAWLKTDLLKESVGDANASTADIAFVGNGFVKEGYFTIKGLKNAEGIEKAELTFPWQNSGGTTGTSVVEGASMKNILKDVLGITDDANTIIFTCKDGTVKEMALDDMFVKDKDGQRPVLAWTMDGAKCDPTLVIGQSADGDVNKSKWLKEVIKVEVKVASEEPPEEPEIPGDTVGDADASTAQISFVGDGFVKEGYFTIKGLKNAEGIEKGTYTFPWQNSGGTTGTAVVEGASMKNILKDVLGITDDANTIIFTCKDGTVKEMALDDMFVKDKDGQRPVLAWTMDGAKCDPTLVIGQSADGDTNKSKWLKEVIKVEVKVASEEPPEEPEIPGDTVGDADVSTAQISFVGDGFVKEGYFTIKGLKNAEGIEKGTYTFPWQNSSGTTGTSVVQGASMKNILKDILGITEDADTIIFTCKDGTVKEMALDDMFTKDKDGQRPVLAWTMDGNKCDPTLVIGQSADGDTNKSKWLKEIIKVEVKVSSQETPEEPPVEPPVETPDLTVTGEGVKAETEFTIKSLKNAEGIVKQTKTYSWLNSYGSTGQTEVEGADVENLLKDVIGITEKAEKVTFISSDGRETVLSMEDITASDLEGNKAMLAWKEDGQKIDLKLIVGQYSEGEVNKTKWGKDIVKIVVEAYTAVEKFEMIAEELAGIEINEGNLEESKISVEAVRTAYEALSEEDKAKVNTETVNNLLEAELAIAEIEKDKELNDLEDVVALTQKSVKAIDASYKIVNKNRINITYSWKPVEGADSYKVFLYKNGKYVKEKTVTDTKYKLTNYKRGYIYSVKVRPAVEFDGNTYVGKGLIKKFRTKHGVATLKMKKSGSYFRIKSADRNSTGYQVCISKSKSFNKNVKVVKFKTNGKALNKKLRASKYLKSGRNYVVVRAYTTYNGKTVYGKWSAVKRIYR